MNGELWLDDLTVVALLTFDPLFSLLLLLFVWGPEGYSSKLMDLLVLNPWSILKA